MQAAPQKLIAIPDLEQLARDPDCARGLPPDALATLAARCAAIQTAIATAQLAAVETVHARNIEPAPQDRTLNADQIAAMLGVNRRWVFRNASKKLPFVRRISRKALAASESAVRRWRETQKA